MTEWPDSLQVCKNIRKEFGERTMMSFSRGKDSIGAYLQLRRVFDDIIPIHFFSCPNLSFVDESLAYYEKVMGRKIYNLPHPLFYEKLNEFMFMPPSHQAVVRAAKLPNFTHFDVQKIVAKEEGLAEDKIMVATGTRAADSPMRRRAMNVHGPVNWTDHTYHAIWDWNKARLEEEIVKSKIGLPVDYEMFGRSLDGYDLRFIYPIRERFPEDYRRLCEFFHLLDTEIARYELYGKGSA